MILKKCDVKLRKTTIIILLKTKNETGLKWQQWESAQKSLLMKKEQKILSHIYQKNILISPGLEKIFYGLKRIDVFGKLESNYIWHKTQHFRKITSQQQSNTR